MKNVYFIGDRKETLIVDSEESEPLITLGDLGKNKEKLLMKKL